MGSVQDTSTAVSGDIAIIGMACLFPGAPDLASYWHNIVSKVDAISDPPAGSWDAEVFYDPESTSNDRVYCKRGGFLGALADFDPLENGIMPSALNGSEPDQWLALRVARQALADAGYTDLIPERHRTAVILGKGTYLNRGNLTAAQHGQVLDQTTQILRQLHPEYTAADLELIRQELKRCLPPFNADTAPGLIPNATVGRIANRLDLMGPSYTIDAACASSLLAIDIARRDLLTGRCDMALVGGMHVVTPVPVLMLFCQLGALSHKETIRPFDENADGTLLSEGLGMIVVKRREDAERDGNRIYATIKGTGVASDGRALSVLAPRVEGEELALRLAYEDAKVDPQTIGLIEAHGTATLVGDATEIQALTRVMGPRTEDLPKIALGSIKSMIGHTMPAAGIAGVIKTALALYHKTLPPTLHVDQPSPRLELDQTPFYINTETRPWIHGASGAPRRAGVNSFGFGGINAHVILEEHIEPDETAQSSRDMFWDAEVCVLQAESQDALVRQGEHLRAFLQVAPKVTLKDLAYTLNMRRARLDQRDGLRLAIVVSSLDDLAQKLERALGRLADPACRKIKDANGIYFADEPLGRTGKLAFLFPGEGAQYVNMLADLCLHFPVVRASFDEMDRVFESHARGYVPSDFIFPRPSFTDAQRKESEQQLWQMDVAIEALIAANHGLYTLLGQLGIQPDAMLGHSTGEFSAMRATGMLDQQEYHQRMLDLNRMYHQVADQGDIPAATLVAVGTGRQQADEIVAAVGGGLYVAMDNCPHQVVLAGSPQATEHALEQARRRGFICEVLPFDRAYHTPLYARYADGLRDVLASWIVAPPEVPLYSCTTTAPFGDELEEMRTVAHDHWVEPVEFRRTVERMYEDGVRLFVEVGPKGNLTTFVEDILRGRSALAVPANLTRRSGITQLNHLLGLLAAHGVPMQLDSLYSRREPREVLLDQPGDPLGEGKRGMARVQLGTGWPPMGISDEKVAGLRERFEGQPKPSVQIEEVQALAVKPIAPATVHLNGKSKTNGAHPAPGLETMQKTFTSLTTSSNGNGNGHATNHTNGNGYALQAPAPSAPAPVAAPPAAPDGAAGVMSAYLQTMEQFLQVQQDVMHSYLAGRGSARVPGMAVAPPVAATITPPQSAPAPVTQAMVVAEVAPAQLAPAEPLVPTPVIVTTTAIENVRVHEEPPPVVLNAATVQPLLLRIVSDKTGYPAEMLDLNLDLEADLGIDSIKRVEILGALQQELGVQLGEGVEQVSSRRTLQGIIEHLVSQVTNTHDLETLAPDAVHNAAAATEEVRPGHPFLHRIVRSEPGQYLVAECEISMSTMPFLRDHTLGRHLAPGDSTLRGLPVVPMTMTMELLSEAAAALMPDQQLVGMREIRAYRWLALDQEKITVRLQAQRVPGKNEAQVQLFEAGGDDGAPLAEGILIFGTTYPAPPQAVHLALKQEQPGKWQPDQLYQDAMFHGPAFRGVRSLERIGEDGAEAMLEILPLLSDAGRSFVTDPVLLDQPGQVVGFWAAQMLEQGYLVFPFRLEALHFFGPPLAPGERVRCRTRIVLVGATQVRSDLEVVRTDGRVWVRFEGWWDRRFDMPRSFYRLLFAPREVELSEPWPTALDALPDRTGLVERRLSLASFPEEFFSAHGGIWQRVLTRLILSRREMEIWNGLRMPETRRIEWLLGRAVAKDAVRAFLRERTSMLLEPADVEILPDENGRPTVQGDWTAALDAVPVVSVSHTGGIAVAIAGDQHMVAGVGVDIETTGRMSEAVEQIAFTAEELALIAAYRAATDDWSLRLWCAKEAAAKAIGLGMLGGPRTLVVQDIDFASGVVRLRLAGELARRMPDLADSPLIAFTTRDGDLIIATSLYGRNVVHAA